MRLMRRDDGPEELVTTTEASAEKDGPEVSMMKTKASIEEAEDTTHLSELLQQVNVYNGGGAGVLTGIPPL